MIHRGFPGAKWSLPRQDRHTLVRRTHGRVSANRGMTKWCKNRMGVQHGLRGCWILERYASGGRRTVHGFRGPVPAPPFASPLTARKPVLSPQTTEKSHCLKHLPSG